MWRWRQKKGKGLWHWLLERLHVFLFSSLFQFDFLIIFSCCGPHHYLLVQEGVVVNRPYVLYTFMSIHMVNFLWSNDNNRSDNSNESNSLNMIYVYHWPTWWKVDPQLVKFNRFISYLLKILIIKSYNSVKEKSKLL